MQRSGSNEGVDGRKRVTPAFQPGNKLSPCKYDVEIDMKDLAIEPDQQLLSEPIV